MCCGLASTTNSVIISRTGLLKLYVLDQSSGFKEPYPKELLSNLPSVNVFNIALSTISNIYDLLYIHQLENKVCLQLRKRKLNHNYSTYLIPQGTPPEPIITIFIAHSHAHLLQVPRGANVTYLSKATSLMNCAVASFHAVTASGWSKIWGDQMAPATNARPSIM